MRTLAVAALVFVLSPRALPQAPPTFDGYWWMSMTPDFKLGWVTGYATAMDSAATSKMGACMATIPLYKEKYPNVDPNELVRKLCLGDVSLDFDGISMGQLVNGIDAFYNDYRNKQLDVNWAIQYARDSIKGKAAQELDAEVTLWRRCSAADKSHPMPRSDSDAAIISKACTPEPATVLPQK